MKKANRIGFAAPFTWAATTNHSLRFGRAGRINVAAGPCRYILTGIVEWGCAAMSETDPLKRDRPVGSDAWMNSDPDQIGLRAQPALRSTSEPASGF
jgi:hypothetical protein